MIMIQLIVIQTSIYFSLNNLLTQNTNFFVNGFYEGDEGEQVLKSNQSDAIVFDSKSRLAIMSY